MKSSTPIFDSIEEAKAHKTGQKVTIHVLPLRWVRGQQNFIQESKAKVYPNSSIDIEQNSLIVISYGENIKTTIWPLRNIEYAEIELDNENPIG